MPGKGPEIRELRSDASAEGQRMDRWLAAQVSLKISRSQLQKLFEAGLVSLDGEQVQGKTRLEAGQRIRVELRREAPSRLKAEDRDLDVLFEDSELLILN